jgi:hypothetical protein
MRESGTEIRKSFYNAINALEYPVFDGKTEGLTIGTDNLWVVLGEQGESNKSNKSSYATEASIEIVIVNREAGVAGRKVVEEVADEILTAILPTVTTHGLTINSPFKITFVKYDDGRAGTVTQMAAAQFDNVKTLNFRIRITQ